MAIDAGTFLRPDTVEVLRTSQTLASGEATGYGLGWDLETVELAGADTVLAGHDGSLRGGRVASFWTWRDRGMVVAVLANTAFADTRSIAVAIARAFAL
ncbi:MAG: serine hydrolase [Vicinamibacterales bacterium]